MFEPREIFLFIFKWNILRHFWVSQRAKQETRRKEMWPILSAALQLHYITSIKPNNCRLRTADCGQWIQVHTSVKKNSSAHIVILKRFLKFAVAKIEMFNSSSLPLTPPCCEAWPPRLGNRGESPLKVTGMFVAFHRGRSCTFWIFLTIAIGVAPIVVRKEIT